MLTIRRVRSLMAGTTLLKLLGSLALSLTLCEPLRAAEPLRVGFFDVDASPPIGSPNAYEPVREVLIPLSCRGIVILGADRPMVLCALDWLGLSNDGHRLFCEGLATAAETTPDRVAVHALHQHDAPVCDFSADALLREHGLLGEPFDSRFARDVLRRASDAVKQATTQAQPVTHVSSGAADVEQVASNRRLLGPDGKVKHVRWSATKDPIARSYPEGVIDRQVKSISLWRDDRRLVTLTYYATHPQSYYRTGKANPDFPGIARNTRQEATGVPHIHFCGAAGNVTAGKYNDGDQQNRQRLADRLADGMRRAWDQESRQAISATDAGWKTTAVALPPAPHLDEQRLTAEVANPKLDARARSYSAIALIWLRRCRSGETINLAQLQLGSIRVLHMPGELFIEYQLAAQQLRPDLFVATAAYGEYAPFYIGTEIAYSQGGYETSERATHVAPQVEGVLVPALEKLLDAPRPLGAPLGVRAAQEEVEYARTHPDPPAAN